MKALHKLLHISAPLAFFFIFSVSADASVTFQTEPTLTMQQGVTSGGEDGKSEAKAEKSSSKSEKKFKPRKMKQYRTNHGPRKPIFPQTDRKKEKLSRAKFLNAQR